MPLKRWFSPTRLNGAISQKFVTFSKVLVSVLAVLADIFAGLYGFNANVTSEYFGFTLYISKPSLKSSYSHPNLVGLCYHLH
jgi:hypothetical protein